ncbi:MAG: GAF domain-containing sensor histidine kinase [Anaerolineae bacterium]
MSKGQERRREQATESGICLVRWALLAAVIVILLVEPGDKELLLDLMPLLAAWGVYSLLVTALLTFGIYFRFLSHLSLAVDLAALGALLFLSGGVDSPLFALPLFPILVASIRLNASMGFLAAFLPILIMAAEGLVLDEGPLGAETLYQLGLYALLYLLAGAVGGVLGGRTSGLNDEEVRGGSVEAERLKTVFEMAASLSATLNYQRVLDTILDISRLVFDDLGIHAGESVAMVLLYDSDEFLIPASHRNLTASGDETKRIRGAEGIVAEAILADRALIGESAAEDHELREYASLQPCKSMICVPLRAGFETYGAVLFASMKRNAYAPEHVELLTIFCNQATIALQNASLYQSLHEERDKIVNKEEEARHKLARDLHDGPIQDVAAIAMRLNFARLLVERDPGRARAELERLEDLAHRTVREIRSMLFTLRPIILETEGLVAALNQYAENIQESDDLQMMVQAEGYRDCLDMEAQGVVFAILEEAVNNARKHAQASTVRVWLDVRRDLFVAEVVDDGVGFDVDSVESGYGSRGSLGMVNLMERAELLGGTLSIESAPNEGTRLTLLVPIPGED